MLSVQNISETIFSNSYFQLSTTWSTSTDITPEQETQLDYTLSDNYTSIISCIFDESQEKSTNFNTIFNNFCTPEIEIQDYIQRINKYCKCSQEIFVISLVYIDRITEKNSKLKLSKNNLHRFVLISFLIAMKFFQDKYFNNTHFANVGGINNNEINSLEKEFLQMIDYDLFVNEEIYCSYFKDIINFQNI